MPIEEVFLCDQFAGVAQYLGKSLICLALDFRVAFSHCDSQRIAKLAVEEHLERGFPSLVLYC